MPLPLEGLTVLDFSTLLPGPLATFMLAEAGAEVIKVEKPGGEDMRRFPPNFGSTSAAFTVLNGGKKSVAADLKTEGRDIGSSMAWSNAPTFWWSSSAPASWINWGSATSR